MSYDPNLETGDIDPAAGDQNEDDGRTVPLSALQAVREELQTAKAQLQVYQTHLRAAPAQTPAQAPPQDEDLFPGIDDDEPLTKKEAQAALSRAIRDVKAQTSAMTDEQAFLARHPDYHEVINKHLPKLFEQEPELLQRLQRHPDPYLAYKIGVSSPSYLAAQKKKQLAEADYGKKAQQNADKPGSPSQVSGKGGGRAGDRFAAMSSDEFRAHVERVKRGG